ncbi:MAG: hypothetical protein VYD27_00230 [Candidatus Thermoplasmatota archaeon]|nr:hypothetical protein [Candidatus Thermoplasmatota archaeon]
MVPSPLDLEIRRVVTDSDLDGVVTAAILRRWWKEAEIEFGHPGELRAGLLDSKIDRWTAVCDLPWHPNCGLSIDHHQSNKPSGIDESESVVIWRDTPSAARIAFDLISERLDLSDMEGLLEWVDKLDGGGVTREEYLSEHPVLWLGRAIDVGEGTAMEILEALERGVGVEEILESPGVSEVIENKRGQLESLSEAIAGNMRIEDRMAIVRLEDLGIRSNGYHVTAMAGGDCDACVIIHGEVGATFGEEGAYPVSASFYTNSFLHPQGGLFDLTKLATLFDADGGGHANACGCRIKPIRGHRSGEEGVSVEDIELNVAAWLELWAGR